MHAVIAQHRESQRSGAPERLEPCTEQQRTITVRKWSWRVGYTHNGSMCLSCLLCYRTYIFMPIFWLVEKKTVPYGIMHRDMNLNYETYYVVAYTLCSVVGAPTIQKMPNMHLYNARYVRVPDMHQPYVLCVTLKQ